MIKSNPFLCNGPPYQDTELFYWHREAKNANAEDDYVISDNQEIFPKALRFNLGNIQIESLPLSLDPLKRPIKLMSLPLYLVNQLLRFIAEF